ncbi:hypothetical protein Cgig2_030912 [Carnegiea gigantea]|uniref:Uncharacterized protein n=1 Tax=Carnegiea gigantea TaxID=171969 RepID=A0A9Q1KJF4_9CARY|nr:hypothetical protein Cgig2_030912 [Carnegiea gigantea]
MDNQAKRGMHMWNEGRQALGNGLPMVSVEKLGILRGWMISIMESALKELRWSTFQTWVGHNKSNILRAHHPETDIDQEGGSRTWIPLWDDNDWPLSQTTMSLTLSGSLKDSGCPLLDRAIKLSALGGCFYAMVVNDALELGVMSRDMVRALKSALEGILTGHWALSWGPRLCGAKWYGGRPVGCAVVFYVMVVNEALELGVLSRDLAEHLKLCLEGTQADNDEDHSPTEDPDELMAKGSCEGNFPFARVLRGRV